MLSTRRSYFALLIAGLLVAIGVLTLTAPGQPRALGRAATGEVPAATVSNPLVVPDVERLDSGEQEHDQLIADRANPQAVWARQSSRTRYERLSGGAAVRVIGARAPGVLSESSGGIGGLPRGVRVSRYLSADSARLDLPGGRHAVVASVAPFAARTPSHGYSPVNFTLHWTGGSFVAENPAAPLAIPYELDSGARLDTTGVSLTPLDSSGALAGGVGRLDGGAVVYPNTETDTDTAIKPIAMGMEVYDTLRSVRSPQELSYKLGLPRGASLERAGGKGPVSVIDAGRTLAVVLPATAVDAAGTPVPVSMRVSGRTIRLRVDHRAGDYLYPVVVDPTLIDSTLQWGGMWRFENSLSKPLLQQPLAKEGYVWGLFTLEAAMASSSGRLLYPTQGESRIYAMSMETSAELPSDVENHLVIGGAAAAEREEFEASTTLEKTHGRGWATVCAAAGCSSSGGTAGNIAAYWLNSTGYMETHGAADGGLVYGASVYIAQNNGPSIEKDTTKWWRYGLKEESNVFYGSGGWISQGHAVAQFSASDPGVGVSEVQFTAGSAKWSVKGECVTGTPQCSPQTFVAAEANSGGGLPEGEQTIQATAYDGMGSSATTTGTIRVDKAAPHEITLSGLPEGNVINDATQGGVKLVAHATDGVAGTPSSGVASLKLAIDGSEVGAPNGNCSPGPCTATGEWTINGEELAVGEHTLTVTATDAAGNSATSNTAFSVHRATPVSFGPGELNPVTGELDLEEADVSVSTIGAALSIARGYDSREPAAGTEGAFGAPWSLSTAGAQELVRSANGNMTLVSTTGAKSAFTAKGGGRFEPPSGDAGLVLSANEYGSEYTLRDNGSTTVFTHVSDDDESVYRAAIASGKGGSNTTQYSYQSIGGLVEPEEELGPVPAGVSCTPTLSPGCRALTFNYASATTATGEGESEWGDYNGRLTRVYFATGEEKEGKVVQVTKTVAQYAYDSKGRLRAEWDPRISPALKTIYGYDAEGHVTAISPPGKESWAFTYGTTATDTRPGRLLKATRPQASQALWGGEILKNTVAPALSGSPIVKVRLAVSDGTWSGAPIAFGYQWQDCNSAGGECKPIAGAVNPNYTPVAGDVGHTLIAAVTATNGGGSVTVATAASAVVGSSTGGLVSVTQSIEAGALNAVSCIPGTTDCVVSDSKGNAYYASNVSAASPATWTSWSGPGLSPSEALSCPTTSFCVIAAGEKGGFGGYLYYATSLGGPWTEGIVPANGVDALYCVSSSFCTAAQDGAGFFRYTTNPASSSWPVEKQGSAAMNGTFCLSSSFCAIADAVGKVHIATSTAQVESSGWTESTVDGTTALNGVACTATSSCIAVDGSGNVLNLSVGAGGEATATKQGIDPANSLTAVTCTSYTCVTVDNKGNVFVSTDSGKTWSEQLQVKHALTSVSCSSATLCAAVDSSGNLTAFDPSSLQAVEANGLNAISCVPATTDCVATDSQGSAYYSTNVSTTGAATWTAWAGPSSTSPSEAISCPSTSLCVMADGSKEDSGGNVYYATSLGGSWTQASKPSYGSDAVSCASSSFCLEGQDGFGFFRYSTSPASTSWTLKEQGANAMRAVYCLSSSFCAMVDNAGKLYVATSKSQIESSSWKETSVDGGTSLNGVACTSTSYCMAVDSAGSVLDLTVGSAGEATVVKHDIDEANSLTAVACSGSSCATVDSHGNVFDSTDGGKTWVPQYALKDDLTGVSCASSKLCAAVDTAGHVFAFDPSTSSVGEGEARPPQPGTTVEYGVPVSGSTAPYQLSSGETAKWAQSDVPIEATAIFPADEPVGWPAPDYRRATVDYLDIDDRIVNVAAPGGGITTSEYNSHNDVMRNLTADDRAAALKEGSKSAEVAQTLDTQSTYNSEGTELTSSIGPLHSIKLAGGTSVKARLHTVYSYDEGAPETGGPYRLVTKVTQGAQISGEPEADIRTTKKSYSGQHGLGWILRSPTATTVDPSGLDLVHTTVYDPSTGNVTETRTPAAGAANETYLGYEYGSTFDSRGSGNGQTNGAQGIAIDSEGNIWVADTENNRIEEFSAGGTFIQKFGGPGAGEGQLEGPTGIAIDQWGDIWVTNTGKGLVEGFTKTGTSFRTLGGGGLLKEPLGIAYSSYNERLYVADAGDGRVVSLSRSVGGENSVIGKKGEGHGEFLYPEGIAVDSSGDVLVSDSSSRIQKLSATGAYISELGSGYIHDAVGMTFDSKGDIVVAGAIDHRIDLFSASGTYQYSFGEYGSGEGQMRYPTGVAVDSADDVYAMDAGTDRIEKWLPSGSTHKVLGSGGTHGEQTIYYTVGSNLEVPGCGNRREWAGLPCEKRPAAQPETSGVPNLPVTTTTYNLWDEPVESVEAVGSSTRTNVNVYDEAGRLVKDTVSSSVGTALPGVEYEYNSETGDATKSKTTVEGTTRTLESTYDKRGELTSYKDADGSTSSFYYDPYGRLESLNDGKGTQTYTYDTTTGLITKLVDSAAGAFTGSYDVEGNLTSVAYPNGMSVNHTFDSTASETGIEYVKTTHCSSGCVWYSQGESPSVHGQTLSQSSTFSAQAYTYDAAGRLTKAQDSPAGEGCTTRIYAYDQETNVDSLTTRAPGTGGVCASEGGAAVNHTYDTANRLTDAGIAYDAFGDITKLPAGDAGGHELSSTFYADETLASQSQNGQTLGYYLDPEGRDRQIVSTGTTNSTVTYHYAGGGSSPAWTEDTTGKWTRNIYGLEGLAATQGGGESPVLQVHDLNDDVVGTASLSETATGLLSKGDQTEYGVPRTSTPSKYSWQGTDALRTELSSGVIAMGARSYVPQIGRFLQPDPIEGGSANAYSYTYGDPVNSSDPSGEYTVATPTWVSGFFDEQAEIATEAAIQKAAEEQAAREEAEEKAREAAEQAAEEAAEAATETYTGGNKKGKGKKGQKGKMRRASRNIAMTTSGGADGGGYKGKYHGKHKKEIEPNKHCEPGEVQAEKGGYCEKGPEKGQRPDPPIPPPGIVGEIGEDAKEAVNDCLEIGLCDL
ncbi:MAG TPA: RHS repeat-associated core domain-containing protein [Solirubrobacteraceae bacterium]|nr:RHS repeat-associated core domain-containing protein [Solirubrobacteraceae bacterium]